MRQVLVDIARERSADKRQGRELHLTDIPDSGRQPFTSLLIMNEAMERLDRIDPVIAQLLEMRYFGGMTAEESAEALSLSVHVVRRKLRRAQAMLRRELVGE